jgi:hypothetical protein
MLKIPEFKQDYILHFLRLQAEQTQQIFQVLKQQEENLARLGQQINNLSQDLALPAANPAQLRQLPQVATSTPLDQHRQLCQVMTCENSTRPYPKSEQLRHIDD